MLYTGKEDFAGKLYEYSTGEQSKDIKKAGQAKKLFPKKIIRTKSW